VTTQTRQGCLVIGEIKERWRELCEQASVEKDPKKMMELVAEINRLLNEKRGRISGEKT
jgi:hypothetical protein